MSQCRHCKSPLNIEFVDLGFSPPSNSFLKKEALLQPEVYYPLRIMVCGQCYLVQIEEYASHAAIFNSDYAYFSSYSSSWLAHAKTYVESMVERFGFNSDAQIVELASNDGYLLQYFKELDIPVLGIEPTANTARVAVEKGIKTVVDFFGTRLANQLVDEGYKADLLLGNNVLAHVPDINDFVQGMKMLLNKRGVITMEFPHLLQLIQLNQFDTIYHEHFSYLSFITVKRIFESCGLKMFDVQELSTHGGSLRIFACHEEDETKEVTDRVMKMILLEEGKGLNKTETYQEFQQKAENVKDQFVKFLIDAKVSGKSVAGYGAAAKGNTLLNFCGVRKDLLAFIVDASPHKQHKFIPGMHIEVVDESWIQKYQPDYVVILPWNLKEEISQQLDYIRSWGGKFVIAVPQLTIF
ncbi:MAG: methyltransferase domain-containing protein [Saprospiraceae bacterium]|nr:methyltransferase domain-containing protein [Candidatus Vicinibacter affinis]MBK7303982.1 methyltransferase domain-containing protein [Candidatus Vicinibacter affinis]MBK7799031.1 methyltransferase domain-containing protein [Candidatus Vicinibacter affinis]MBP6173523.1 methyltransferase domain-containing protein [Saprospiraceae bacterium]MBP6522436.1 methyltransferase domain-containing protein [Saprospiraceae bacterium]